MVVVDSQFRHPKFALLLVLSGMLLAFVTVAGPRDGGVVGVGDASAADAETTTTVTTDPNYDDGVVFTVPGELGAVIEGPSTTSGDVAVGGAGATPDPTVVAPSTTSRSVSPSPDSSQETDAGTATTAALDEPAATTQAEQTGETSTDGSAVGVSPVQADEVLIDDVATTPAVEVSAFVNVPDLIGSANGAPADEPVVLGQVSSTDSASVPWMLLIGANFLVAGGALVALRLRR